MENPIFNENFISNISKMYSRKNVENSIYNEKIRKKNSNSVFWVNGAKSKDSAISSSIERPKVARPLSLSLSPSLSLSLSLSQTNIIQYSHTISLSLFLSFTHTHTHILSHSPSRQKRGIQKQTSLLSSSLFFQSTILNGKN